MVVESRLNPVWFDGSDISTDVRIERHSQLVLSDGVRTEKRKIYKTASAVPIQRLPWNSSLVRGAAGSWRSNDSRY